MSDALTGLVDLVRRLEETPTPFEQAESRRDFPTPVIGVDDPNSVGQHQKLVPDARPWTELSIVAGWNLEGQAGAVDNFAVPPTAQIGWRSGQSQRRGRWRDRV